MSRNQPSTVESRVEKIPRSQAELEMCASSDSLKCKKDEHSTVSWSSQESISLLMLLPALNMLMVSATYSYLPVHFLDMKWSLTLLGVLLMIGNGARLIISTLVTKYGDWVMIMFLIAPMISYIFVFIRPTSEILPTFFTMVMIHAANTILSLNGLIQQRYGKNESAHKTSLRICTVAETFGYASGTFIGGLLYEYGGWTVCCIFSFVTVVLQIFIMAAVPTFRNNFYRNFCTKNIKTVTIQDEAGEENRDSDGGDDDGSVIVRGVVVSPEQIMHSIKWYILVILGFHLMNLMTYGTEWALFAVFFRQEYNWSSGWTGAGQMTGDLLAAFILFLSVAFGTSRIQKNMDDDDKATADADADADVNADATSNFCFSSLLSPPWHILMIGLSIGILNIIMVLPNFTCSVFAQIFMGTSYVFGVQTVNELLRKLSKGSKPVYRKLAYHARLIWDSAVSFTGLVSLIIYEHLGPRMPFILVGCLMFLYCIVYFLFVNIYFGVFVNAKDIENRLTTNMLECATIVSERKAISADNDKVKVETVEVIAL
jgi:hypothetical protein